MGPDRSMPTAPPGLTASVGAIVVTPQPKPRSSTDSPGRSAAALRTAWATGARTASRRSASVTHRCPLSPLHASCCAWLGALIGRSGSGAGAGRVEAASELVDRHPAGAVGEQPPAPGGELGELVIADPCRRPGEQTGGGVGDRAGGFVHRGEEREHVRGSVARGESVGGELLQ